jgi:hypothetical protein
MRRFLIDSAFVFAFVALFDAGASAHPISGIVADPKGQVFFQTLLVASSGRLMNRGSSRNTRT